MSLEVCAVCGFRLHGNEACPNIALGFGGHPKPQQPENRITRIELEHREDGWYIEVTKVFAPEYGGGFTKFKEWGGDEIHTALRRAAYMVTLTPASREVAEQRGWEVQDGPQG